MLLELGLADELVEPAGPQADLVDAPRPRWPGSAIEQLVAHRRPQRATASERSASRSRPPASPSSGRSRSASRDLVGPVAEAGQRVAHVGRGPTAPRVPSRRRRRRRAERRGRAGRGGTSARPAGGPPSSADAGHEAEGGDVVVGQQPARRARARAPRGWRGPAPGRRRGRRAAPRSTPARRGWRSRRGVSASSRTWWWTWTNTSSPTSPSGDRGGRRDRDAGSRRRRTSTSTSPPRARSSSVPRSEPITAAPPLRRPARPRERGRGRGGRGRGQRRRRRRPAAGGCGEAEQGLHHALHLLLVGAAPPATASFTWLGVYCDDLARRRRRPRPWRARWPGRPTWPCAR